MQPQPDILLKKEEEQITSFFENIHSSKKGGKEAPYKDLLLLYMLGRVWNNEERLISYRKVRRRYMELLKLYFPEQSKTEGARRPFWHLKNDSPTTWEIHVAGEKAKAIAKKRNNQAPGEKEMLASDMAGGFIYSVYVHLSLNKLLLLNLAYLILDRRMPRHLHFHALRSVGINASHINYDRQFQNAVAGAYSYHCSVCNFSAELGGAHVGIEAAHIKLPSAGGPSVLTNGLAFCSLHRNLFDSGCFTVSDKLSIEVSRKFSSQDNPKILKSLSGRLLKKPVDPSLLPEPEYLDWHRENVFETPILRSAQWSM